MKDRDIEVIVGFAFILYIAFAVMFAVDTTDCKRYKNRRPIVIFIESLLWPVIVMAWFVKWLFTPMK